MVFSAPDQALLRSRSQTPHTLKARFNAVPLVVVATAQINQASFVTPIAQVTVDNTSADWLTKVKQGMAFAIGTSPGGTDVTWGVVRKTPASATFFFDAKSLGDPGYARNIIQPLADNLYITIYKHRPPWAVFSSIRNKVFYKNYDIAFAGQTTSPDPIVNLGQHHAAEVDSVTGLATFVFQKDVYTWNKTLTSLVFDLDGGTQIAEDSTTLTATFPPGFYVVTALATDSRGKTRLAYRYVWANPSDPTSDDAPFSARHVCKITTDRQDANGRSMTVEVYGDLDVNEIYPGQAFLFTEDPKFAGVPLDDQDSLVTSFIGYVPSKSLSLTRKVKITKVELQSPITASKGVPSAVQLLTEVVAPKNWTECTSILSNPVGAAYYTMNYHAPFLMNAHDLDFDTYLLQLRFKGHEFSSRDIQSQLQGVAARFLGNIGCRSDGTIRMVRNPMYLTNAMRGELPTQWTWFPSDFTNSYEREIYWLMKVGWVYGYAFSQFGGTESTPYASLAPGRAQGQGVSQDQMNPYIVIAADGQVEVNRLTGHHFALLNAQTSSLVFDANRNLDVAEPCDMDRWHQAQLFAQYDPEGLGFTDRAIAVSVSRKWTDSGALRKTISIEFLLESFGQPGVTMPILRGAADTWESISNNPANDVHEPPMPDLGLDLPIMLAGNSNGTMGRSQSFDERTVQWERQ